MTEQARKRPLKTEKSTSPVPAAINQEPGINPVEGVNPELLQKKPDQLTPRMVLSLQHTYGNHYVANLIQQRHQLQNPPDSGKETIQRVTEDTTIPKQELIPDAALAFNEAQKYNNEYGVKGLTTFEQVYPGEQAKIIETVKPAKGTLTKRLGILQKFVRAFVMGKYAGIIHSKKKAKSQDEMQKARPGYFQRTLLEAQMQSGLLDKPITAPETQSFLEHEGLTAGIKISEKERERTLEQQVDTGKLPCVEVRSTFITGGKHRAHLFIIYTDEQGNQTLFRGGPSGGRLRVSIGVYDPNSIDWDPSAPSVVAVEGNAAKGKLEALIRAANAINAMGLSYIGQFKWKKWSGQNCNAAARTMLYMAGIPANKPSSLKHMGWQNILIGKSGKNKAQKEGGEYQYKPRALGFEMTRTMTLGEVCLAVVDDAEFTTTKQTKETYDKGTFVHELQPMGKFRYVLTNDQPRKFGHVLSQQFKTVSQIGSTQWTIGDNPVPFITVQKRQSGTLIPAGTEIKVLMPDFKGPDSTDVLLMPIQYEGDSGDQFGYVPTGMLSSKSPQDSLNEEKPVD